MAHLIVIFSQGCLGSSSKSPHSVLLKFICEKWADCFSRTGKASFLPTPSQFTRYFHPSGNPMVSQSSSKIRQISACTNWTWSETHPNVNPRRLGGQRHLCAAGSHTKLSSARFLRQLFCSNCRAVILCL